MVEIKFRDQFEVADLAGKTVSEVREQFHDEFGIPVKASAKLNGETVKGSAEIDTVLADDDKLTFAVSRHVGLFLVGAAILALAVTGSVFAFGFINATGTLGGTAVNANFADVTANNSLTDGMGSFNWNVYGFYKGSITSNNATIFNVRPAAGYPGDLETTITLGNADQLARIYKVFALQIQAVDPANPNVPLDISAGNGQTWAILSLDNGSVSLFTAGSANLSIQVKSGFYISHAYPATGWPSGSSASPQLFAEVSQR
jgi:hypothetical protein